MVSEFDLPCADCDQELQPSEIEPSASGTALTVAECPTCGSLYYPESTLEQV